MKEIIEKFILNLVDCKKLHILPFDQAISHWVHNGGNIPVLKVASDPCLSSRQFERKCSAQLGTTSKLFIRLLRFAKAHVMAEQQYGKGWANIAQTCRYFDKMHMMNEFKKFTGSNPSG